MSEPVDHAPEGCYGFLGWRCDWCERDEVPGPAVDAWFRACRVIHTAAERLAR